VLYCGRIFSIVNNANNNQIGGKIVSIEYKKNDPSKILYFKFYDNLKYRAPPSSHSSSWEHVLCSKIMSTDANNKAIIHDISNWAKGLVGNALVGRTVRKGFTIEKKLNFFKGVVKGFKNSLYRIEYEDGDGEELCQEELVQILKP